VTPSLSLPLIVAVLGQTPEALDTPAGRLQFMKESLATHEFHPADDPATTYRLQLDPVLRFKNTLGVLTDGGIFLWVGASDRPEAAVKIYQRRDGMWYQEFSSLATAPISTEGVWQATRPGVELKPIPGAPRPAETPEQRFRQIRDLIGGFSGTVLFRDQGWHPLRLLPTPLARYGKPGTDVVDGALFGYVLTTDPNIYLMIEARTGKDGLEWQYDIAPAAVWALKGSWKGEEVLSLPFRQAWTDRHAPFYVWHFYQQALVK
jgi:hypothetical protein